MPSMELSENNGTTATICDGKGRRETRTNHERDQETLGLRGCQLEKDGQTIENDTGQNIQGEHRRAWAQGVSVKVGSLD